MARRTAGAATRRGVAAAAIVAVLVLGLVGALRGDPRGDPGALDRAVRPDGGVARGAEPALVSAIPRGDREAAARADVAPDDLARIREVEAGPGVLLRVVRAQTGAPVAFATLEVVEVAPRGSPYGRWDDPIVHEDAGAARRIRTDAHGRARVPWPARTTRVACTRDGEHASVELHPYYPASEHTLRLEPDGALEVALERAGAPAAAVQVEIVRTTADGDEDVLDRARAGEDGVARFPHARALLAGPEKAGARFTVRASGLFAAAPEAVIDPDALPARLALALAPSARLEVAVRERDGSPATRSVVVRVRADDERLPERLAERFVDRVIGRPTIGGVASFEVDPGLDVVAAAGSPACALEPVRARAARAGESSRIELVLEPPPPLVVARVLDDGTPLRERAVHVSARTPSGRAPHVSGGTTDAEGRLRIPLNGLGGAGAIQVELTAREVGRELVAVRTLDGAAAHERTLDGASARERSLGDVDLAREPLLIAGRVVDSGGRAVPGAQIHCRVPFEGPFERGASCLSDAEGRFEIRAASASATLAVVASHVAFGAARVGEVAVGGEVVVRLGEPRGGVAGSLALGRDLSCEDVSVRVVPDGDPGSAERATVLWPGTFELRSLPPGRYDVAIVADADLEPAVTIPGVVVRPGEIARDPRLLGVDVDERVHAITLRALDAAGAPIEHGDVEVRSDPASPWRFATYVGDGAARVVTAQEALDVRVSADGFWPAVAARARGSRTLVLERTTEVRFHWANPPPEETAMIAADVVLIVRDPCAGDLEVEPNVYDEPGPFPGVDLPPTRAPIDVAWLRLDLDPATGDWTRTVVALEPLLLPASAEAIDVALDVPALLRAAVEDAAREERGGG